MSTNGKLKDIKVMHATPTTSGGRPATEFWLTEAQALKVAAKSETEPADALLDEMIRVFRLVLEGKLPGQQPAVAPARVRGSRHRGANRKAQ